jgi:hypothetical protein
MDIATIAIGDLMGKEESSQREASTGKDIRSGQQRVGASVNVGESDVEKEHVLFLPLVRPHRSQLP